MAAFLWISGALFLLLGVATGAVSGMSHVEGDMALKRASLVVALMIVAVGALLWRAA